MSSIKLRCLDDFGDNIFLVDSLTGIYSKNTIESSNSSSGAFFLYGGLSINKTSNSSSATQGGALTIAGGASFAKDVHIGGNLTVWGSQTQIVSQTVNVQDNFIVVNSSPITGRDAGILFQRFQTENDTNLGDVIKDTTPLISSTVVSSTSTAVVLNNIANSTDNYYTGCFIKITSGAGVNQVRKITSYTGSTRTAVVNTAWTTLPVSSNAFSIYNRVYATQYYNETTDRFTFGWTVDDPGSTNVNVSEYIGVDTGSVTILTTSDSIGIGSGGSFTVLGGASISKSLYIGDNLTVSALNGTTATFSNLISSFANFTNMTSNNITISNITSSNLLITNNFIAIGNSNTIGSIITTGGNVGIGTSSPLVKLDVNGAFNASGACTINEGLCLVKNFDVNYIQSGISITTSNSSADLRFTSISAGITWMTITSSGNIGIGTTNPNYNLDVIGFTRISGGILATNMSNTLGNLFTYNNNVGINIVNPAYQLDVNGNVHVNANLYVDGLISGGTDTGSTFAYLTLTSTDDAVNLSTGSLVSYGGITIQSPTDAVSVTNGGGFLVEGGASIGKRLFVGNGLISSCDNNTIGNMFTYNGNVGINTTSPQYKLDISCTSNSVEIRIGNSSFTGANLRMGVPKISGVMLTNAITGASVITNDFGPLQLGSNGTGTIILDTSGNVGIGTANPVYKLDVSGNIRGDSLIVGGLGTYTYGTIYRDASWGMLFRSGTNNPINAHFAWANYDDTKLMCISSTNGNVGIATTTPRFKLDVSGSVYIESSDRVNSTNITTVSGGSLNVNGDMVLSGTSGVYFTQSGIHPPTIISRSLGSKIILYPSVSSTSGDYALGIENSNMWSSVPDKTKGFVWYQGIDKAMSIGTSGNVTIHSTENATGLGTGGSFKINGGGSIMQDLYIGGALVVSGQNLSGNIINNTTIGSFSGTGVYEVTNISIGSTMSNTNYKIFGSLQTTTNNTNVYTISFKNLKTTTFDVVIYRIDSLGSGWTDPNLKLTWQITP